MGLVVARETVYLEPQHGGLRNKGERFEYSGPDHECLEPTERGPYEGYSLVELKNELTRRGIGIPPIATPAALSELLVGDDNSSSARQLKPKSVDKTDKARAAATVDGSGFEKYGASDWTADGAAGLDYPGTTDGYHSGDFAE